MDWQSSLMLFLNALNGWYWFGLAIILFIVEILGCAGFLFWIGIAAALVGGVLFIMPTLAWPFQLMIFGLGSILSSVLWWVHLRHALSRQDNHYLNQRGRQYVGRVFTLADPIINGRGQIKVDDSQWRVEGPDLPAGTNITVIDVDGTVLKIQKTV